MFNRCRPLLLAVIFMATAGAATAAAQTVLLLHAPAGAALDVTLNGAKVGSAAVGADGQVKAPLSTSGKIGSNGLDTNVYLDVCGKAYHIVLVDNGRTPAPAEENCDRRDISGIFWVRPINTLVIDVAEATPSMLLIKGEYKPPPAPAPEGEQPSRPKTPAPAGLMAIAGGGAASFSDLQTVACGNLGNCTTKSYYPTYTFGAEYWFKPWLAAAGSFIRPAQGKVNGSSDAFTFNTGLDTHLYTMEGKIGVAESRFKIYGHGGVDFQQSTMTTNETIQATTITTADGTVLPVPGGTQTVTNKTSGWSWLFGAGGEFWIAKKAALYSEVGIARLKGSATDGSQAVLDDHNTFLLIGLKFRLQH
jgi:hypothetical protein